MKKKIALSLISALVLTLFFFGFNVSEPPVLGQSEQCGRKFIYINMSGIDGRTDLTPEQKAQLKQCIINDLIVNFRLVGGKWLEPGVTFTDDARYKGCSTRQVKTSKDIGEYTEADGTKSNCYGLWNPSSSEVDVFLGTFMDFPESSAYKDGGTWNITKLNRAIGRTVAHELAHSYSVGHNDEAGLSKQTKMTRGDLVSDEDRAKGPYPGGWTFDPHSNDVLRKNFCTRPCNTAPDYEKKAIQPHTYESWCTDEPDGFDAKLNFTGPLFNKFELGWLGADSDYGAIDGNSEFDFIYKTSLSLDHPEQNAEFITFFEGHHDYVHFVLRGTEESIWEDQWFTLRNEDVQLSDFVTTSNGNTVARKVSMTWNVDGYPGPDVEITLDTNGLGNYTNPYNGFTYGMPLRRSDSWPMFGYELARTRCSPSTAPVTNQTLWSFTTGWFVKSSPAIADGRVYVVSEDRNLYCLDAFSGSLIWNYTMGAYTDSSPAVADGRVYVGSSDKKVYCLNALNGALIWNYTTGSEIKSSPAVADGMVFIGSYDNKLCCLNATDGSSKWNFTTGWGVQSSAAIADGRLYIGSNDKNVYCLNASNGALVWNYTTGDSVFSSPAVVDGKVYVGSYDNRVYCLNASTGTQIWNFTTNNDVLSCPAVAYDMVFIGSWDRQIYCLNAQNGTRIWNYTADWPILSSAAVADGKVYVGCEGYKFYCFDATSGDVIWTYQSGGGGMYSSPAIANDIVYVGSYDHGVYAFADHDIAVSAVVPSKTIVGSGYSMQIKAYAANRGYYTETFNVTVYANMTSIADFTNIVVSSRNFTEIAFMWNTSGLSRCNYIIWAYAWPVPEETFTHGDNPFIGNTVAVVVPCDITGPPPTYLPDGICNMRDIGYIVGKFMTTPARPNWDPNCDVTGLTPRVPDGKVDMRDVGNAVMNFGKTYP